jgi:hypothetical protein
MTIIRLISYLEDTSRTLREFGVDIKRIPINTGTRFHNKLGVSFNIKIFDQEYSVGFYQETIDKENWKFSETKLKSWCRKNSEKYSSRALHFLLENFKTISRNRKINQILK